MASIGTLSTANVPPEYLKALFLVGQTPITASSYDSRISYALYLPSEHYNPNPTAADPASHPFFRRPVLPLLAAIHGTKRDATGLLSRLVPFADSIPCAILTPLFPAGLDGPTDLDSYKDLRSKTLRSDLALLGIIDEVSARWPGIRTDKFSMIGFSGGGQFVQRFLYLHPDRLNAVSIGAPGRITSLNQDQDWPKGTKDVRKVFGLAVDIEKVRQVTIQMVVGDNDNFVHGGDAFWKWLRKANRSQSEGVDADGRDNVRAGRLDTLKALHAQWRAQDIKAKLDVVPAVAHDSAGVQSVVLDFIAPFLNRNTTQLVL